MQRQVLAALALAGLLGSGCAVQESARGAQVTDASASLGSDAASGAASAEPSPAAVAVRVGSVTPEAPTDVVLPSGTSVPVRSVATTGNGLLDVPENIRAAGWWRGGSQIGDPFGSTLIAAHVDSATQGLGPFAELLGARPGEQITVRTGSLSQEFQVDSLRLRPKGSIGPRSALHSPEGERRLTLVTCAGPFLREQGGYQNLAVVVATPIGDPKEING